MRRFTPPLPRRLIARSVHSSPRRLLPRATDSKRTFAAASSTPPPPATGPASPPPGGPGAAHTDIRHYAFQRTSPPPSPPPPPPLEMVRTQLETAFLPKNQPLAIDPSSHSPFSHVITFPTAAPSQPPAQTAHTEHVPRNTQEDGDAIEQQPETVIALASPFEGGEIYVGDAIRHMASHADADIVRIDLVAGLAFGEPKSRDGPFGIVGLPGIPHSLNPARQPAPSALSASRKESQELQEQDDQGGVAASYPLAVIGGVPLSPGSQGQLASQSDQDLADGQVREEWVYFFTGIINQETREHGKRRIIVLESPVAMNKTIPVWWASFVEAVQRRRKGLIVPGRRRMNLDMDGMAPELLHPTTIVLQCSPSLLLSQTVPPSHALSKEDSHSADDAEEEHDESEDHVPVALQALEERFRNMGFNVQHHVEVVKPTRSGAKLWWGSEESDVSGRKGGDQARLKAILARGMKSALPTFESPSPPSRSPSSPIEKLMNRLQPAAPRQDSSESTGNTTSNSLIWRAYPIIPAVRNLAAEKQHRTHQRRLYSAFLIDRAVRDLGGHLQDPLQVLAMSEETGKPLTRKTELSSAAKGWGNAVISWDDALHVASTALGKAAQAGKLVESSGLVPVHWQDIIAAKKAMVEESVLAKDEITRYLPKKEAETKTTTEKGPEAIVDPVVERLKKDRKLSSHEKRLLGCIVDPTKLASTSFKDVHLPEKTVDGIRTIISLPLLFPEAFRGGVLKDHATTGALLFGPPGTGKTLLARAVAAESGARMLAIQPSDVNDMYVGEGEKLVKSVFSLARRLSPCVIFLDEVDALFSARSSRSSGSSGSQSHNLILTEFMQEMDGLSSAIENKDKRVVIVGATNRPFDLDDAVLRRLPRRLLVDLPGVEGRKAILDILLRGEKLGEDVNLDKLAKGTDGFSGSDLKHLCVSAALAAVKDTVDVPWRQLSSSPTTPLPGSATAETEPGQTPRGSGRRGGPGGGRSQVLVMAPSDAGPPGGGGRKKAKVNTQKAAALKGANGARAGSLADKVDGTERGGAGRDEEQVRVQEQENGDSVGASQIQGEIDDQAEVVSTDKTNAEVPVPEPSAADQSSSDPYTPSLPERTLLDKHFQIALREIRPSASEEGSLPELRKWAEQFGEGGTRKGKKSGFGKGFGFGEVGAGEKGKEEGYGRVRQDEE